MKKILCSIFALIMFIGAFAGCGFNEETQNDAFVKPEKYAAIVNVSINPSFDIYLDEKAIVLAIEPKNEDAKKLDFSDVTGLELKAAMLKLMDKICKNTPLNMESVVFAKFVEGEERIVNLDVIEIINDACADVVARETVNESMESVLQVRLEDEYGCQCMECNNWYERHWYSYIESACVDKEYIEKAYENYMENWKNGLDAMDKNDSLYALSLENYENMTVDKFDFKEIRRRQHYAQLQYDEIEHEEKVITYKIIDSVSNKSGSHVIKTEELTAEEYFEKNPDDRETKEGLQKAVSLVVEVYVNGELDGADTQSYYRCVAYQCNDKWYVGNGPIISLNP